jgi:tetratricopeptide (TPR) repeat protein
VTACPSEQRLSAWISGVLPLAEAQALHAHLKACDSCRLVADLLEADHPTPEWGLKPGQRIGPYLVHEWLGAGGMGEVWAAYDTRLDRRVALKVLEGPQRAAVMHEARALARLNHPNVATVYDLGELDGVTFLAMELLPGGTLREWLGARQRSLDDVLTVFAAVAQGLAHAHSHHLVHRDFKPDNVLFADDGTPRVADFGLAALDLKEPSEPLRSGEVAGTPAYLSPEALRGEPPTARSDQYAFGVTFRRALERLPKPAPRAVHALATRLIAPDPRQRFPSMEAVEAALQRQRPTARTRRHARAALAATLALVALAGFARERRCASAGELAQRSWSLLAARLDPIVGTEIHRQLEQWRANSQLACAASADERTRCLDEELHRFEALSRSSSLPEQLALLEGMPSPRRCDFATPLDAQAWSLELERRPPLLDRLDAAAKARGADALVALQQELRPELDRTAWALALSARLDQTWSDHTVCDGPALETLQNLISASHRAMLTALESRAWTDLALCQRQRGATREAGFSLVVAEEVVCELPADALARRLTALRRGTLLTHLGSYDQAARTLAQVASGSGWLEGLRLSRVALLSLARQDPKSAVTAYERAVPLLERSFGADHRETRSARHNLASSYTASFRYAEALALLAPADPDAVTTPVASDLVPVLLALGRNAEALHFGRRSLVDVPLNDLRAITSMGQQLQAWALAELAAGDKSEVVRRLETLRGLETLADAHEIHAVERRALEAAALLGLSREQPRSARALTVRALELLEEVAPLADAAPAEGRQLWARVSVETLVALDRPLEAEHLLEKLPLDSSAGLDPLERATTWLMVARSLQAHGLKSRAQALMSDLRPFASALGPRARRLFGPT